MKTIFHSLLLFHLYFSKTLCADTREYTVTFTLSKAIPTDVYLRFHDEWLEKTTKWFNIGPLSAESHPITITAEDIGRNIYDFEIGMYGLGGSSAYKIEATLRSITTMDGSNNNERYNGYFYFWFYTSTSNCFTLEISAYDDRYYTYGPSNNGCGDFRNLDDVYVETPSPTATPTDTPTNKPTPKPTSIPTDIPTDIPTLKPSTSPTNKPTIKPTNEPTIKPTDTPTTNPTLKPTTTPSIVPSVEPSNQPTFKPSVEPSDQPTIIPSNVPTVRPSEEPTSRPSYIPSNMPSNEPSNIPSSVPTAQPTVQPTGQPSFEPSFEPSLTPSEIPTKMPTMQPTTEPTNVPTFMPSVEPTRQKQIIIVETTNGSDESDSLDDEADVAENLNADSEENTNKNNDNKAKEDSHTTLIISIICTLCVILFCILGYWIYVKRSKAKETVTVVINSREADLLPNSIHLGRIMSGSVSTDVMQPEGDANLIMSVIHENNQNILHTNQLNQIASNSFDGNHMHDNNHFNSNDIRPSVIISNNLGVQIPRPEDTSAVKVDQINHQYQPKRERLSVQTATVTATVSYSNENSVEKNEILDVVRFASHTIDGENDDINYNQDNDNNDFHDQEDHDIVVVNNGNNNNYNYHSDGEHGNEDEDENSYDDNKHKNEAARISVINFAVIENPNKIDDLITEGLDYSDSSDNEEGNDEIRQAVSRLTAISLTVDSQKGKDY